MPCLKAGATGEPRGPTAVQGHLHVRAHVQHRARPNSRCRGRAAGAGNWRRALSEVRLHRRRPPRRAPDGAGTALPAACGTWVAVHDAEL